MASRFLGKDPDSQQGGSPSLRMTATAMFPELGSGR
jgi:hypothetical protein